MMSEIVTNFKYEICEICVKYAITQNSKKIIVGVYSSEITFKSALALLSSGFGMFSTSQDGPQEMHDCLIL